MSTYMDKGECDACGGDLDEGQSSGHCDECSSAKSARRSSNQEFLADLMNFSRFGPLAEVFIMEAVRLQAKEVAAQDPAKADQNTMLSPHLWVNVARDISARFEERTTSNRAPVNS